MTRNYYYYALALTFHVVICLTLLIGNGSADATNGYLSRPNRDRDKSFERIFGLGVVLPYPYFQKPKYRYPVYDRSGRGTLFYGYGGPEVYRYRAFTPIEGHH